MGNCATSINCSKECGNCCKLHNQSIINMDEIHYKDPKFINSIIKIQAFFKGKSLRKNFKIIKRAKSIHEPPGTEYNLGKNPINLCPNIIQMEKAIGTFSINNKDTPYNMVNLKKYCLRLNDNSVYYGHLNTTTWQKEGFGILYSNDGCKYEGYFKDDMKHGPGRLLHIDGYYYEGNFEKGKTNGFGKYVNLDGTMYIGYWKDEKQHGFGEEIFSDYSRYEGNYENGK